MLLSVLSKSLFDCAQAEREKANKIIRMNSLRQRRELAMAGVKLEQKFQDEQAKSAKQKEQEEM